MEVKNLFDPTTKQELISRINKLTANTQPLWGKMNVAQMLAHLQMPIGVADGTHTLRRSLMGRIFGPLVKKMLYNEKPYKHNLPTAPSFVMTNTEKEFETEKAKLVAMINRWSAANMVNETHPFFGKLTRDQWSMGVWKHIDHHLQQFGV